MLSNARFSELLKADEQAQREKDSICKLVQRGVFSEAEATRAVEIISSEYRQHKAECFCKTQRHTSIFAFIDSFLTIILKGILIICLYFHVSTNFPLYTSAPLTVTDTHSRSNSSIEKNCMNTNMGICLNAHTEEKVFTQALMTKEEAYTSDALGQHWFTYPGLYSGAVRKFPSGSRFVEVGSWKGRSAIYMAIEIMNSQKEIQLDCVDTWTGSIEHADEESLAYDPIVFENEMLFKEFMNNTEPYRSIINPIRMDSFSASALYDHESLDFVFLDSSHEYEHIITELSLWVPKIKRTGVIAGHDYHASPGVHHGVNHYFHNNENYCPEGKCVLVITELSWVFFLNGQFCDPVFFADKSFLAQLGCDTNTTTTP